ncbi:MAG: DUF4153 domain-containing protein [Paludibacter sp.]|nr:DUF4153 domain-containing protein [Paludibacter sp.]
MKKISLKTWIGKILLALVRFPFTLLFIIGLSVLCFLSIQKVTIHENLWAFFILGLLLNVPVTLLLEEFKSHISRILLNLVAIILLSVYCFTLPNKLLEYQSFQLIALGSVFVLSAFVNSFLKRDNEIQFWNFSKNSIIQVFISSVFSQVLFAGLALAMLSLDKLFNIHIDHKVYSNLAVVCFVIFAPVYFLSNIPNEIEKRSKEITFNKILKIFGLYILLPILAAYTLILYIYLFQIIIKWQLPNGWVSTLVSVLAMVGFLCMMILYPLRLTRDNKLIDLMSRYFPVVLLPLLVLMSVGIFRRISDYSLTINRLYVLILNIWLYGISIYLYLSKSNYLKWIIISFALIAFLSSVGPWSVFNVTRHSLDNQLNELLLNNHLLKDGKVAIGKEDTFKVDSITKMKTVGTIKYLVRTFGNESIQRYFSASLKDKSESEILAMLKMGNTHKSEDYFWIQMNDQSLLVDIQSYHSFLKLNLRGVQTMANQDNKVDISLKNDNLLVIAKNSTMISIPLKEKVKFLVREKQKNETKQFKKDELTIKGENFTLIITSIAGKYNEIQDKLTINTFDAYLFY